MKYVGIMKDILKKAKNFRKDPCGALLIYKKHTPQQWLPSPMEILNKYAYIDLPVRLLRQSTLHQQRDMGDLNLHTGIKQNPDGLCKRPASGAKGTTVMGFHITKKTGRKGEFITVILDKMPIISLSIQPYTTDQNSTWRLISQDYPCSL